MKNGFAKLCTRRNEHINPLNTGGTSNVCLLTKFFRLTTICGVKVSKQWNFGKLFFQWGLLLLTLVNSMVKNEFLLLKSAICKPFYNQ